MKRAGSLQWCALTVAALAAVAGCSSQSSPRDTGATLKPSVASPGSAATGPSTTSAAKPVSVTVSGSGDILLHSSLWREAAAYAKADGRSGYEFDPMFAKVRSAISASDLALCHQETPVSSTDTDLSVPGSLVFNVPREIATTLKRAGFEGCDVASNHTIDRGLLGMASTRRQLTNAGLGVAGPSADPNTSDKAAMYGAKGVKIAHLAYTYTLPNSSGPTTTVPADAPWLRSSLWPAVGATGIIADATAAKKAGADLVIVSMHWGTEAVQQPTADQLALAKALTKSPSVDAIFGTHAHIVQPCTKVNGKFVFYGFGNFISNQGPGHGPQTESNRDGVLAEITFTRDASGQWSQRATYQPTHVNTAARHTVELSTPTTDAASWNRTRRAMNAMGSCPAVADGS